MAVILSGYGIDERASRRVLWSMRYPPSMPRQQQTAFTADDLDSAIADLSTGLTTPFPRWKDAKLPSVAIGLYSIWRGAEFVYVGMAGRSSPERLASARAGGDVTGLADRLNSHASGRRSGDQFCVYVSDRLVIQGLTQDELQAIAGARLSLDALVKRYIHENLAFRAHVLPGIGQAERRKVTALERHLRSGATPLGLPLLNPLR
jgi:hypothetical protein